MTNNVTDFPGCCGASVWFFDGVFEKSFVLSQLKEMLSKSVTKSIAVAILTTSQHNRAGPLLIEFGFVLAEETGIRNINTGVNLYTYICNLNTVREKEAEAKKNKAEPAKRVFEKPKPTRTTIQRRGLRPRIKPIWEI